MSDDDHPQQELQQSPASGVLRSTKRNNREYIQKLSEQSRQRKQQAEEMQQQQGKAFQLHVSGANVIKGKGPERSVSTSKVSKKWETQNVDLSQYSNVRQKVTYQNQEQLQQQNMKYHNPFDKHNQMYAPEALYDINQEDQFVDIYRDDTPLNKQRNISQQNLQNETLQGQTLTDDQQTLGPNQNFFPPPPDVQQTLKSAQLNPQVEVRSSAVLVPDSVNSKKTTLTDVNILESSVVPVEQEEPYDFNNLPESKIQSKMVTQNVENNFPEIQIVDQIVDDPRGRTSLDIDLVDIQNTTGDVDDGMTPCAIPSSLLQLMQLADRAECDFIEPQENFQTKKTNFEIYDGDDLLTSEIASVATDRLIKEDSAKNEQMCTIRDDEQEYRQELEQQQEVKAEGIPNSVLGSLPGNRFGAPDIRQQMASQILEKQGGIDALQKMMTGKIQKDAVLSKVEAVLNDKIPSPLVKVDAPDVQLEGVQSQQQVESEMSQQQVGVESQRQSRRLVVPPPSALEVVSTKSRENQELVPINRSPRSPVKNPSLLKENVSRDFTLKKENQAIHEQQNQISEILIETEKPEIDLPPMNQTATIGSPVPQTNGVPGSQSISSPSRPLSKKEKADNLNKSLQLNGINPQALFQQIMQLDQAGIAIIARTLKRIEDGETANIQEVLMESIRLHSAKGEKPHKQEVAVAKDMKKPPNLPLGKHKQVKGVQQDKVDQEVDRQVSARRKQHAPLSASKRNDSSSRLDQMSASRSGQRVLDPNPDLPQTTVKELDIKPPSIIKPSLVEKNMVTSNIMVIEILSTYQQANTFTTLIPILLMNSKQTPFYCLYRNTSDQQQINLIANSKVIIVDCIPSQLNPIYLIPIQQYNIQNKYALLQETKKSRTKNLMPNQFRVRLWQIPHFAGVDYKNLLRQFIFEQQFQEAISYYDFLSNLSAATSTMDNGVEFVFKEKIYQRQQKQQSNRVKQAEQTLQQVAKTCRIGAQLLHEQQSQQISQKLSQQLLDTIQLTISTSYNSEHPGLHSIQFFDDQGLEFAIPEQNIKSDAGDCRFLLDSNNILSKDIKFQFISPTPQFSITISVLKVVRVAAIRIININNENLADNCSREIEVDFNGEKQKIFLNQPFCFELLAESSDFIILKDNPSLLKLLNQNDRLRIQEQKLKGLAVSPSQQLGQSPQVSKMTQLLNSPTLNGNSVTSPLLRKLTDAQLKVLYRAGPMLKITIQVIEIHGFTNNLEFGGMFVFTGTHSNVQPSHIQVDCSQDIVISLNCDSIASGQKTAIEPENCELLLRSTKDLNGERLLVHYFFEGEIQNQYIQNIVLNCSGSAQSQLKTVCIYVDDHLYCQLPGLPISQMEIDNQFLRNYESQVEILDTEMSFTQCLEKIDSLINVPIDTVKTVQFSSNADELADKLRKQLKQNPMFGKVFLIKKDPPISVQQVSFQATQQKVDFYEFVLKQAKQLIEHPTKHSQAAVILINQKIGKQLINYAVRQLQQVNNLQINILSVTKERFGFNQFVLLNSLKEKISLNQVNIFSSLLEEQLQVKNESEILFTISEELQMKQKSSWFFRFSTIPNPTPSLVMKCHFVFQEPIDLGHISVQAEGVQAIQIIANNQLVFEGVLKKSNDMQGICFVKTQKPIGSQIEIVQTDVLQ